jgi:cell division protein FtsX
VSLMLITIGIIVGTLGSSRAVRKYLKIWFNDIIIARW